MRIVFTFRVRIANFDVIRSVLKKRQKKKIVALCTYYVVIKSLNEPNYMEKVARICKSNVPYRKTYLLSFITSHCWTIFATYDQIMKSNIYHFGGHFNDNLQDIYDMNFLSYDVFISLSFQYIWKRLLMKFF